MQQPEFRNQGDWQQDGSQSPDICGTNTKEYRESAKDYSIYSREESDCYATEVNL